MTTWGNEAEPNWVSILPAKNEKIQIIVCRDSVIKHVVEVDNELHLTIVDALEVVSDIFWRSGRRFGSRETSIMGW